MTMTLTELKEYLRNQVSEVDLLELLDITTEELVISFSDEIEDKMDTLISELGLEEGENDELE